MKVTLRWSQDTIAAERLGGLEDLARGCAFLPMQGTFERCTKYLCTDTLRGTELESN